METKKHEFKLYKASECCVFRKTKELYGGLSNMASGFPIKINGVHMLSSEALYQALRFPHLPDVQEKIIREKSPMTAKMVGKPYRNNSRADWNDTRIKIMRWCLRVKLAQNFIEFGKLLERTCEKPIVEDSSKDNYWGAIRDKQNENILIGTNALGRLLMELRLFYNENRFTYEMFVVEPLNIPDFKLYGQPIDTIDEREEFISFIKNSMRYNEIEHYKTCIPNSKIINQIENERIVARDPEKTIGKKEEVKKESKKKTTSKKYIKDNNKFEGQATLPF